MAQTIKKAFMPNLTAPRGTQDVIPPLSGLWQELEARIHELARGFGYGEIRTPAFEATELFIRGVGELTDIVEKEMYSFTDRGGRSLTLRPELTAPVVRAALESNLLSSGGARLYYLGPIFRYERPQRGRFRQSHQFGVECFGYRGAEADFEVIQLAWELARQYQLSGLELHINTIGDETCRPAYRSALKAYFNAHRSVLSEDSRRRLERNPLRILDSKAPEDAAIIADAPPFESMLCDACRAHFDMLKHYLEEAEIAFRVNPRIVRGLDYYTRTVFEIMSDALGAQSAVCAGGRYDDLVRSLGGPEVPAVGFALGIERFLMVLESSKSSLDGQRSGIQLIALGAQARERLVHLLGYLRQSGGLPAFMDYEDRKLLAQLKIADRNNARYALIAGDDELASGQLVLRDLATRLDRSIPFKYEKDTAAEIVKMALS
ncbi:MAG: histidine--tRNA ligase [Candidatus Eremiobacteraeota bacterium]|nr:histidine--tRNA ligase [Candidatus Eremiobacteraeota bacterium]